MTERKLTMMMVGDIILDDEDATQLFDASRALLNSADIMIGHVEVPHTNRGQQSTLTPGGGGDPKRLGALGPAGCDIATLGANHLFDYGWYGVQDTLEALRAQGIKTAGAGMNIGEAREPAIVERGGVTVGVLSYNCVGPKESWASEGKPGAAYVHTMAYVEGLETYTFAAPKTLRAMQADIEKLKATVDVAVVALHKGSVHVPVEVLDVEQQLAYAAIEAGADLVIGHHQHILRGIEFYKGVPIYHGLCNFVCVTNALSIDSSKNDSPERLAYAEKRRKLFGFDPDPAYPKYPFHPEARNSMIATVEFGRNGIGKAGFIPVWIRPNCEPEPLENDEKGREVADYVRAISVKAGFKTKFSWDGDQVTVSAD